MISLGDGPFRPKEARDIILAELRLAGVTNIITEEKEIQVLDAGCPAAQTPPGIIIPSLEKSYHSETHFRVSAKLHGWKIYRAWYYWIASCEKLKDEIHAEDAMALFNHHGEKMRVDGDCGCPAPKGNHLHHHCRVGMNFGKDGYDLTLDEKHHVFVPDTKVKEEHWMTVFEKLSKEYPGPVGGVKLYHIDSQDALVAFTSYVSFRAGERKKAEDAYQKEEAAKDNWKWDFKPQLDGFIPEEDRCPKKPEKNETPSSPSAQAASEAATTAPGESS